MEETSKFAQSLTELMAFLSMNLFVKIELSQLLNKAFKPSENYPMEQLDKFILSGGLKIKEQKI